jgi:hypothetical protein
MLFGALGLSQRRSEQSRYVEHRNIVVGLGTPSAGGNSPVVFGWLISPRRTVDPDTASVEQHRLQAMISIPSWWSRADIEAITCWITPAEVAAAKAAASNGQPDLWQGAKTFFARHGCQPQTMSVRLPHSTADISSKLRLSGVPRPRVTPVRPGQRFEMPQPVLVVGRQASLVIIGDRLWRNTEVTLGEHRALSIRLMPDMRGLIAEFGPLDVLPQESRRLTEVERLGFGLKPQLVDNDCARMVPVRVWTSEGMTEVEGGVLVHWPLRDANTNGATDCSRSVRTSQDNQSASNPKPPTGQASAAQ